MRTGVSPLSIAPETAFASRAPPGICESSRPVRERRDLGGPFDCDAAEIRVPRPAPPGDAAVLTHVSARLPPGEPGPWPRPSPVSRACAAALLRFRPALRRGVRQDGCLLGSHAAEAAPRPLAKFPGSPGNRREDWRRRGASRVCGFSPVPPPVLQCSAVGEKPGSPPGVVFPEHL